MPIGKYIYCTGFIALDRRGDFPSQMPIGKYIYCTSSQMKGKIMNINGHKCLSASTFTVPEDILRWGVLRVSQMPIGKYIYCTRSRAMSSLTAMVTNAYRQVHLLYPALKCVDDEAVFVTNAYRQVHLLYPIVDGTLKDNCVTNAYRQVHLLYTTTSTKNHFQPLSQMPIGKYIYCTPL